MRKFLLTAVADANIALLVSVLVPETVTALPVRLLAPVADVSVTLLVSVMLASVTVLPDVRVLVVAVELDVALPVPVLLTSALNNAALRQTAGNGGRTQCGGAGLRTADRRNGAT
ncbi:unnamed protein product, partial [Prorocentrum cordatum]